MTQSPDFEETIKLVRGRTLNVTLKEPDGSPKTQIRIDNIPATAVDLVTAKLEEKGYELIDTRSSYKFDMHLVLKSELEKLKKESN